MTKTYSKAELEKKARRIFKNHPKQSVLFATSDGQYFVLENRANLHASGNKDMEVFKVQKGATTKQEEAAQYIPKSEKTIPADELKTAIAKMESISELKAILEREQELSKPRKSVLEAAENQIKELEK